MHGVVTIGTAAGVAELEAAAAICAAARENGSRSGAFVASATGPGARAALDLLGEVSGTPPERLVERLYDEVAPPLLAARLGGAEIAPDALLAAAREVADEAELVAVATSGGLLAPIAARYANRDLARELGLPVVLAVAA